MVLLFHLEESEPKVMNPTPGKTRQLSNNHTHQVSGNVCDISQMFCFLNCFISVDKGNLFTTGRPNCEGKVWANDNEQIILLQEPVAHQ